MTFNPHLVPEENTVPVCTLSIDATYYDICRPRTLIGRADDADIEIIAPSISKHHLALYCHVDGTVSVEDLKSSNGSYFMRHEGDNVRDGAMKLEPYRKYPVSSFTRIMLGTKGHTTLGVVLKRDQTMKRPREDPPPPPPSPATPLSEDPLAPSWGRGMTEENDVSDAKLRRTEQRGDSVERQAVGRTKGSRDEEEIKKPSKWSCSIS